MGPSGLQGQAGFSRPQDWSCKSHSDTGPSRWQAPSEAFRHRKVLPVHRVTPWVHTAGQEAWGGARDPGHGCVPQLTGHLSSPTRSLGDGDPQGRAGGRAFPLKATPKVPKLAWSQLSCSPGCRSGVWPLLPCFLGSLFPLHGALPASLLLSLAIFPDDLKQAPCLRGPQSTKHHPPLHCKHCHLFQEWPLSTHSSLIHRTALGRGTLITISLTKNSGLWKEEAT